MVARYSNFSVVVAGSTVIPHTGSVVASGWEAPTSTSGWVPFAVVTRVADRTRKPRRRLAFVTTDSELSAIAPAAIIGLKRRPKNG